MFLKILLINQKIKHYISPSKNNGTLNHTPLKITHNQSKEKKVYKQINIKNRNIY